MPPSTPPSPPAAPPRRRWSRRLAQGLGGVVVGLAVAEGAFHLRDHGAFPHLNVYRPDARLGVRLRPGTAQRISAGKNPVTSIRINADGLRGADLPPPEGGEILVVGDSQVFGLGVEEQETASAQLAKIRNGTVINAGVPTYGPIEYNAVVEEMLARRRVSTVVYVVNLANDLFEAARPNTERHTVWDGWAVRKETAPEKITAFPGREILFRQSHLVHALRSFLYARGPAIDERGFASEGTPVDLVGAAVKAGDEHARAAKETEALRAKRDAEIADATAKELAADIKVDDLALDTFQLRGYEQGIAFQKSRDNPGDIVVKVSHYPEESRGPVYTANVLFNGAQVRKQMEERIRAFAEAVAVREKDPHAPVPPAAIALGGYWFFDELAKGKDHPLLRTIEEREALKKRLDELRKAPAEIVRAWSPITPLLRQVKASCDARGARLLVVALPMDLMVSPAEWAKYGAASPVDMASTKILIEDLIASAEALGAAALDATPALAAAEPGAFLDGDIHMTPKGQRALAEAIAAKLGAPSAARQ
ncbi:MAG: hypothetical protein QM820_16440 [Minicystis sp.]